MKTLFNHSKRNNNIFNLKLNLLIIIGLFAIILLGNTFVSAVYQFVPFNPWGLVSNSDPKNICTNKNDNKECCNQCSGTSSDKCLAGPVFVSQIPIEITLFRQRNSTASIERRYSRFCVGTDQFSQIAMNQSFTSFLNATNYYKTWVSLKVADNDEFIAYDSVACDSTNATFCISNSTFSTRNFWNFGHNDAFAAFYIVVINMEQGVVTSVTYQNTCKNGKCNLGGTVCVSDNSDCAINKTDIVDFTQEGVDMDVKFYIAFEGTDRAGIPLQSLNLLPTQYTAYALPYGLFKTWGEFVKNKYLEYKTKIQNTVDV